MTTGILKLATDLVVSLSASTVVSNAIKATTPAVSTKLHKVGVAVGTIALGSLVGDAASKYANSQIDEIAENYREAKKATLEKKPELRERINKAKQSTIKNVTSAADAVKKKAEEADESDTDGSSDS